MGARLPGRAGLAAVGIAEGEVDAGDLLVLQQHADHVLERDVGAEGELADAVAVLVGVAVVPELLLEILTVAVRRLQASAGDLQGQRAGAQVAVLGAEVVAGGAVADKHAVDAQRRGEHFARRQVRPVAAVDQAARFHPGQRGVEGRGQPGTPCGFDAQPLGARHPLAEALAQLIDQAVVGAHPLFHDLRRDPDHVRVADRAALDDRHDRHAGAELALLGLDAQDAGVGPLEHREHGGRRGRHRPRGHLLDQHPFVPRAHLVEHRGDARRHFRARLVGDQRDPLAALDGEADLDGVARARRQFGGWSSKHRSDHSSNFCLPTFD